MRLSLLLLPLALAAGLLVPPAQAQSDEAIRQYLRRDCVLNSMEVAYRGPLKGARGPVAVVMYSIEYCGGGNNWFNRFGVFYKAGNRVALYPVRDVERHGAGPWEWQVNAVQVEGGRLVVSGRDFGPDDAHCCPTLQRRLSFVVQGHSVVPAP